MILKKIFYNIFSNYSFSMINYIESEYLYSANKYQKKKIFLLFLNSQKIILIYFLFLIIIKNFFSLLLYRKKFNILIYKKKKFLFKILMKMKILQIEKSLELFNALISIETINNEKIKKIKLKKRNFKNEYDCVVIGSGPGGSVTALELINNKKDVLVMEMGSNFNIPNQKHPGDEFYRKWKNSGLSSSLGNTMLQYSSGSCLGGGSEINSGLCHDIDIGYLEKVYGDKSNFKKLLDLNFFKKYVNNIKSYQIDNFKYYKNLYKYIDTGADKLNWSTESLSKFSKIIDNKIVKNSMSRTLLNDYLNKGGAILDNFELKKIKLLKNNKIELITKNKNKKVKLICDNLFICCGAPYSSLILKKNNLIKKKVNDYFHFHPMIKIISKFPKQVNDQNSIDVATTQITQFYPKYLFGNAASGKQFLNIATFNNQNALKDVNNDYKNMTIFHSTFTGGRTKVINIPLLNEPIIFNFINNKEKKLIYEGAKKLIEFLFECGADYLILCDKENTKIFKKDLNSLDKILKNVKFNISSVHLLGGLRMGKNIDDTLDSYGKLKNINHNIYVNDSSLLSYDLLRNPQSMIMQICHINVNNFLTTNKN